MKTPEQIRTVDEILRPMGMKEAQSLAMASNYNDAISDIPDAPEVNVPDAAAFFLEGYNHAIKLMKDAKVLCHVIPELSKSVPPAMPSREQAIKWMKGQTEATTQGIDADINYYDGGMKMYDYIIKEREK